MNTVIVLKILNRFRKRSYLLCRFKGLDQKYSNGGPADQIRSATRARNCPRRYCSLYWNDKWLFSNIYQIVFNVLFSTYLLSTTCELDFYFKNTCPESSTSHKKMWPFMKCRPSWIPWSWLYSLEHMPRSFGSPLTLTTAWPSPLLYTLSPTHTYSRGRFS